MKRIVGVSGTSILVNENEAKNELDRLINRAMEELYSHGARRFRFIPFVPRHRDERQIIVVGWRG